MTSTEMVRSSAGTMALPSGSDPNFWSDDEKALVEAAGLVAVDARSGAKTAAPRPVVAAFLQHCHRTGLDPFARQIYCLARKSKGEYKWTTQISIDGARLVAERSGKYRGQTTPEFTADGLTWTEVWLSDEQPKAARVGVYRDDFAEPLYAIALWEAYAVYQDVWRNGSRVEGEQTLSAMWAKMGPLMLAKCAEMLALRKAFPQDLSGLYSTEEMDQAGGGVREVVKQAEAPQAISSIPGEDQYGPSSPGVYVAPQSEAIATPEVTRDWKLEVSTAQDMEELTGLATEAQEAGEIGLPVEGGGIVMDLFHKRRKELESQPATLVDVPPTRTGKRQWVREARLLTTREQVRDLIKQAVAAGALAQNVEELEAIENTLPDPEADLPVASGGWPVAEIPETEWVEDPETGEFSEQPMALGDGS